MPNCDWYATRDDHRPVVQALFDLGGVEVWELTSRPYQPLSRFDGPAQALAEFGEAPGRSVCSQLRVINAAPPVVIVRTPRNPEKFGPDN